MMKVSWNKPMNPILNLLSKISRPWFTIKKVIYVPRTGKYRHLDPIKVYVYYIGPPENFVNCKSIVLNIPGGGFTCMPPPCHESNISLWCRDTCVPLFAVDYKKAPEYPFPYAIEECFDLYKNICDTKGRCLGLNHLKIVNTIDNITSSKKLEIPLTLIGDSAGGNILCGIIFKALQYPKPLPLPKGIIMVYPCLDFNLSSWMTNNQVNVFRSQSVKSLKALMELKDHFKHDSPLSINNDTTGRWSKRKSMSISERVRTKSFDKISQSNKKKASQLTMTSRVSYFNDRMLTPDMMRAMAILYIGPDISPDFNRDYYISPIVAPEELLAKFPPTYLMCGERDPFVDDTVLFGGRIRLAKKRMIRKSGIFSSESTMNKNKKNLIRDLQPLAQVRPDNNNVTKDNKNEPTQNVKFSIDTKQSKFTIGDDSSSDPDIEYRLSKESTSSNDETDVEEAKKSEIDSRGLLAPIRSYARLFPMYTQSTESNNLKKFNEKYDVDIKLLQGCSHAFMVMYPFLQESRPSVEFISAWIKHILS